MCLVSLIVSQVDTPDKCLVVSLTGGYSRLVDKPDKCLVGLPVSQTGGYSRQLVRLVGPHSLMT